MTSPATAAVPGEEEMLAAYNAVWQAAPNITADNVDTVRREAMSAVRSLFAPILAEKDVKEIGWAIALVKAQERALAAEAALAGERERCAGIAEAHDKLPCRSLLEGERAEDYDCGQIDAATSIAAAIRVGSI